MIRLSAPSIRFRLTVWYVVVLSLMLVVYASATFVAVRHEFFEQLDDELQDDVETAEGLLGRSPGGRIVWSGDRYSDPEDDEERGLEVWSTRGEAVYRAGSFTAPPPGVLRGVADVRYASVTAGQRRWRTLTATTKVGGDDVVVRVARSEDRIRRQLREILTVLVFGLPLIVGLAGVGGYGLARRALVPIDQLASAAQRITADRLHERLSVPSPRDEIGRLAAVINETIARLEASFDQLRRFTADASHELRTPLSVIRGIGELGLRETLTAAEYKDAIGGMLEEVDRLTKLVDSLLLLSRADTGTVHLSREVVDLAALAQDVCASLGVLAEDRGRSLLVDAHDNAIVFVDRMLLREAIANVVDNAIKYSPAGSTVAIRVRRRAHDAVLDVEDEGAGIPAGVRDRIFDRFFRVDEARSRQDGGTGLGLAIAKWAVEANGGRISVHDGTNRGSIFRLVLPLRTPSPADDHRAESTRTEGRV